MKIPSLMALVGALTACSGRDAPSATEHAVPTASEITRALALRERHGVPMHTGRTAIVVDSVAVHHVRSEASTIVWRDEGGRWRWSQVIEIGPGGLLPTERKLVSNEARILDDVQGARLDRLIADRALYGARLRAAGVPGIGAPFHVMRIVTPFGRRTMSWEGRLTGVGGSVADIVLSAP